MTSPDNGTEKVAAVAVGLRRPRVERVTIRKLIGWYGHQNRSIGLNSRIKLDLAENGLYVRPDFAARVSPSNHAYRYHLDHPILLRLKRRR